MNYKPFFYRLFFEMFDNKLQELPGAEIIKTTDKAYLIKYCNQESWISKKFVKTKKAKIYIDKWIIEKEFV